MRPGEINIPAVASFEAEDENLALLLAILQCTIKALEKEPQVSGTVSEPSPQFDLVCINDHR